MKDGPNAARQPWRSWYSRTPGSAGNSEAALEWITGELGLAAITQEHVQNFCWYQLPMKWLISHDEKLRVAAALGEVLDLLQMPRYASICRSQATREILGAYEESLNRKFVQQNADRFGWDFDSPPRTEDDLYDLHQVREVAQQLGLARRMGRKLTLTAKGRRLGGDPEQLWRAVAVFLLAGDSDFTVYIGELFLALLLRADSLPCDEILATVWRAASEEGFRENRTGEPPSEVDVSRAIHETSNLCRALGLLTVGADWRDRSYGLTGPARRSSSKRCAPAPRARGQSSGPDAGARRRQG